MNINCLIFCSDCSNKQSSPELPSGVYYCPYVKEILPKGIVYYDTDATECVEKGFFREIHRAKDED